MSSLSKLVEGKFEIRSSLTQVGAYFGMLFVITNPGGVIIPQFYDEVGLTSALVVLASVAGWDVYKNLPEE